MVCMFTHIQYRSRVTLHLAGITRLARASHSTIYARVFGECCFLCPIMHTSETCVNGESDFFCLKNVLYFCNSIGEDEDNVKRSKVHSRPSNLLYPCKVFSSSSSMILESLQLSSLRHLKCSVGNFTLFLF